MEAIPETFEASQIDPRGRYKCPLCDIQTTSDEADTGWVHCPMLNDRPICLGCCLDLQNIARSENFMAHPYRGLFDEVGLKTGKDVTELRQICLRHQEAIVRADIEKDLDEYTRQETISLLAKISARIKEG